MGNLSDILKEPTKRIHVCSFRDWRNSLDESDQQALIAAFANEDLSDLELTRRLQKAGCPVGRERIKIHRHFECKSCDGE